MFTERNLIKNYSLHCIGYIYFKLRLESISSNKIWKILSERTLNQSIEVPFDIKAAPRVFSHNIEKCYNKDLCFLDIDNAPIDKFLSFGHYKAHLFLPVIQKHILYLIKTYKRELKCCNSSKDIQALEYALFNDNHYFYWFYFLLKKIGNESENNIATDIIKLFKNISSSIHNSNLSFPRTKSSFIEDIKRKKEANIIRNKLPEINTLRVSFARSKKEQYQKSNKVLPINELILMVPNNLNNKITISDDYLLLVDQINYFKKILEVIRRHNDLSPHKKIPYPWC